MKNKYDGGGGDDGGDDDDDGDMMRADWHNSCLLSGKFYMTFRQSLCERKEKLALPKCYAETGHVISKSDYCKCRELIF